MADKQKLSGLRLMLITAAIAGGAMQAAPVVLADEAAVSEKDMITQAVALYEKLSGSEIEVPSSLASGLSDPTMSKAVVLGFANADELNSISEATGLRKQDAMTVLYKTIIDFDDSYALSTSEVDEIMNKCYDNALIDEENRVGYAFMLKHGIIDGGENTEPNKEITWDSCKVLIDVLYDSFMQNLSFSMNGSELNIGSNASTLIKAFGEPNRIDSSDYGFDWYVYNSDYKSFMMVGVKEDRICAFISNSANASFADLKVGDDYLKTYKYTDNSSYRFFTADDATIDCIMYNPYDKVGSSAKLDTSYRSAELIDCINAYRTKNDLEALGVSSTLWQNVATMPSQAKYIELARDERYEHTMDDATHDIGYDAISIYSHLVRSDDILSDKVNAIGVSTAVLDNYDIMASVAVDKVSSGDIVSTGSEDIASLPTPAPTESPSPDPTEEPTEIPTEPPTEAPTEVASEDPTEDSEKPTETATPSTKIVGSEESVIASSLTAVADTDGAVVQHLAVKSTIAPEPTIDPSVTEDPDATPAPSISASPDPDSTSSPAPSESPSPSPSPEPTAMPGSPEIVSYANESVAEAGKDVVFELAKSVSSEYYVRIYSIEDDEYIVDSYIRTDDTKLTFSADLFTAGKDYNIEIGAVTETGIAEALPFTICYGEVPEEALIITSPEADFTTDDDFVKIEWESDIYHDFIVDIYDAEGQLLISQPINDANDVTLTNIDPGEYTVYVNALRRGYSDVIKTQAAVNVTIELPEPIITEYILDDDEKFYPIYEDAEMGILYFYEEDIIDVDVVNDEGVAETVKRKKITEKQVKAVAKYKRLAEVQQKVEYFEGGDKLQLRKATTVNTSGAASSATAEAFVKELEKYLGVQYVWGGTTPSGFDCSGLVQYCLKQVGVDISRTTYTQVNEGVEIPRDQMQPGDLIFFAKNGDVHHVGVYVGNGMMIHAPYTGTVVQYQQIETGYYDSQFYCARRVF